MLLTHGSDTLTKSSFFFAPVVCFGVKIYRRGISPGNRGLRCVVYFFYLNKFIIIVLECCKGPSHILI